MFLVKIQAQRLEFWRSLGQGHPENITGLTVSKCRILKMIRTTSILWADGKKVDASVENSQSVHLDICSLKGESYRWTDQCWRENWKCFRSIRNAHYFQAIASLYLENKLGLSIGVMFENVIWSSFSSVSSKSSVITYLAVGAGLDFTKYWKRSRTFGIQSTGAIRKLNTLDPSPKPEMEKKLWM